LSVEILRGLRPVKCMRNQTHCNHDAYSRDLWTIAETPEMRMPQLVQVVIWCIMITRRPIRLPIRVFAQRLSGAETRHGSEAAVRRRVVPSNGRLELQTRKLVSPSWAAIRLEATADMRQARAAMSDHLDAWAISPTSRCPSGPISWMPLRSVLDPAKTRQFP
jgi:hypothetical protein